MSDPLDPPEPDPAGPWDLAPQPEDPDAPRERHDAFTQARKAEFLRALVKTGCILDACRLIGISPRTVYRHQESDPAFFEHCRLALGMSGAPVEITAWQRAVEGVEQEFACGGQVHVRRRYDSSLLRLLLQGSNPGKYGPRPGFKRKRLLKYERKRMEREIRAEIAAEEEANRSSIEDVTESILRKVAAIERHREPEKLAAGWTRSAEGHWVPPGYAWIGLPPGAEATGDPRPGAETPRVSM